MTRRSTGAPDAIAARRRTRYALQTAALLFAVTACCVFAGLLAGRFPARLDVTATREHRLSPRTEKVLAALEGPHEIVVVANFAERDPVAARRTADVLDVFRRRAPNLSTTVIDVASARGAAELDGVLARAVDRYRDRLATQSALVEKSRAAAVRVAEDMRALSDSLIAVHDAVKEDQPNAANVRRILNDWAAGARAAARDLDADLAKSKAASESTIGRSPVPALDEARATVRGRLGEINAQLSNLRRGLADLAKTNAAAVPAVAIEAAPGLERTVTTLADGTARQVQALDDLPRLPLFSVARALMRSSAALVMGPPTGDRAGMTAVDIESLLPPAIPRAPGGSPAPSIDLRARTEEILAAGLAALDPGATPVVVLVHGAPVRAGPEFGPLAGLVGRLRLRGIDVTEWATALDERPPPAASLDPSARRPIVYVGVPMSPNSPEAAARMGKLARALSSLVSEGKPLLLSVTPSTLPAIGQPDPLAEPIATLGLAPDTARPLLRRVPGPRGDVVSADFLATNFERGHPVGQAVSGLNTHLLWPIPLRAVKDAPSAITPLLEVPDDGRTWAESEWLEFSQHPAEQRPLITNPPAEDSSRDDGQGPWTVAAAIERKTADGRTQRVVAVGASAWFLDELTQAAAMVENRRVLISPGNAEFFEASVMWLAGLDASVGSGAESGAAALIPPMSEGAVRAVRWALVAGLPVLILLIGAAWRLIRG